jgi:lipopolysaccharide biosynthesis glycosyltransferase
MVIQNRGGFCMLQLEIFGRSTIDYEVLHKGRSLADPVHIAFGVDQNFIRPMGVCIASILEKNPQAGFVFHLMIDNIREKDRQRLQSLAEKSGSAINLYYYKAALFEGFPTNERLTKATYCKLLAPEILKNITKRVLSLDADIICLNKVLELWNIDLQSATIAAVMDHNPENNRYKVETFGLKRAHYFNAGVLLIDIEQWNRQSVSTKAFVELRENPLITIVEQDALNILLNERVLLIDPKWNHLYSMETMKHIIPKGTAFLHYTDNIKPWHADCRHPLQELFLKCQENSPWAQEPFEIPGHLTRKRKKAFAWSLWKERRYVAALIWSVKYISTKR